MFVRPDRGLHLRPPLGAHKHALVTYSRRAQCFLADHAQRLLSLACPTLAPPPPHLLSFCRSRRAREYHRHSAPPWPGLPSRGQLTAERPPYRRRAHIRDGGPAGLAQPHPTSLPTDPPPPHRDGWLPSPTPHPATTSNPCVIGGQRRRRHSYHRRHRRQQDTRPNRGDRLGRQVIRLQFCCLLRPKTSAFFVPQRYIHTASAVV